MYRPKGAGAYALTFYAHNARALAKRCLPFGFLIAVSAIIASCATLTREECLRGDWYNVGIGDGQAGRPFERIDQHKRACRTTATVDEVAYRAGRNAGLTVYCTPVSGYRVASSEEGYANVCPVETAPGFLEGFALGQQVASAQRGVQDVERRIRSAETQARTLEVSIAEQERILVESNDEDVRRAAQLDLRSLRLDLDENGFEQSRLRDDLEDARFDLRLTQERTFEQLQALL